MRVAYGSFKNIQATSVGANYSGTAVVDNGESSPNVPTTFPLVDLHCAARKLKDLDVVTVSDPICVLYIYSGGQWQEFARTEVVWNNLNPEWVKIFRVMYVFEIRQPLLFRVYDVDSETASLRDQDFIGEATIDLSQIVGSTEPTQLELRVPKKNEKRGTLIITPEQVENSASVCNGRIRAMKLKKMHTFSRNTPFFVISKASEGGKWLPVLQSEVDKMMNWREFTIPIQLLCNLDFDRPLRITFYNHRKRSAAEPIGHIDATFSRFGEMTGQLLKITDDKNKEVGQFKIDQWNLQQKFSFYDYLRGGVQLNLVTAIDFTASNGDPNNPKSLHFLGGQTLNQYEQVIRSVGEVLCQYDSDQLFPVLGFGAKVGGRVEHCFPLTFNPQAPCVQGLEGIIGAYKNALMQVQLSGPTLFSQVIRHTIGLADRAFRESRTYTILLILTDGVINDMQDTIDAIVDAGRIPLSIIIVGIGSCDFKAMDVLDADDEPLVSRTGQRMVRDLVQFVPFRKYGNQHYSVLATEVLEEVPRQFCEWAEMSGVRPAQQ